MFSLEKKSKHIWAKKLQKIKHYVIAQNHLNFNFHVFKAQIGRM